MKKSIWLVQAFIIGLFSLYLQYVSPSPSETCKVGFVAIIPLFILASYPELWRNVQHGAIEIENTTYFNMKKIYLVRFMVFGIIDLIGITVLILIAFLKTNISLYMLSLYVIVPFISTCCISLTILKFTKSRYSSWYGTGISALWILLLYQLVKYEHIYEKLQASIWIMIISVSLLYMIWVLHRIFRQMETQFEKIQGGNVCY